MLMFMCAFKLRWKISFSRASREFSWRRFYKFFFFQFIEKLWIFSSEKKKIKRLFFINSWECIHMYRIPTSHHASFFFINKMRKFFIQSILERKRICLLVCAYVCCEKKKNWRILFNVNDSIWCCKKKGEKKKNTTHI